MSIAITEDHRALSETAVGLPDQAGRPRRRPGAARGRDRGAARRSGATSSKLGWLGLHLPEEHGGSGYGLEELVVVVEELGRAVAPGPVRADRDRQRRARRRRPTTPPRRSYLPGLADGSTVRRGRARRRRSTVADGKASGNARRRARRRARQRAARARPATTSPSSRSATASRSRRPRTSTPPAARPASPSTARPCTVIPGARQALVDRNRLLLSAEAMGVARECTELAAAYAKERIQFGRPIAMYQAVKHHCANMCVATELATSAVWDAAMAAEIGGDQLSLRRRRRRHARRAGRRPVRQPQHPGARRHRHHLGARRPPLHAPGHHAAALHRRRAGRRRPRRPQPQGRGPRQGHRAPARGRGDPRRGEGLRRLASRTCRPRSSAPSSSRPAT